MKMEYSKELLSDFKKTTGYEFNSENKRMILAYNKTKLNKWYTNIITK